MSDQPNSQERLIAALKEAEDSLFDAEEKLALERHNLAKSEEHNEALCERIQELMEERDTLFANSEWRPMETAPLDGTDILCFCVEPELDGEENPWTEQKVCFFGKLTEDYSCWMSHYGYEQNPTHWMPLPKPPTV